MLLAASQPNAKALAPAAVVLQGSIRPVEAAPVVGPANPHRAFISRQALTAAEANSAMEFEVALKMRNFAELQARVNGGEHISPAEVAEKYEPLPADYRAVADWLTSQGFKITHQSPNHLAIFASGKVSQVGQAMQVTFARVTSEGKEYTSAVTAPNVPSNLATLLIGINGLQPHIRMHKHIVKPDGINGTAPYTPGQIAQAYQVNGLYSTNITGAGQTIAIVIDTFPATSDLIAFWDSYGINQTINNISFIHAVPGTLAVPSGEETLDTEWSSAMAPGAHVRVYGATDLDPLHLDMAYDNILTDVTTHPELGIHQMSMSYGIGEIEATNSQMDADHTRFVLLANAGVTIFASSGDGGSTPSTDINGNPELETESPASDPNVIGVGGTTLRLNPGNNESSEVVWNNPANATWSAGASGGGTSGHFLNPGWQKTPSGVSLGTKRLVPDISCASDPNYGADTVFGGFPQPSGGTSWASPTCAAFCALINQARANIGLAAIGQSGPQMGSLIYPLTGTANFRDITSGNNAIPGNGTSLYAAGPGYDEATGIGVPLVQTLAKTLAGTQTLVGVGQQAPFQTVNQGLNATITVTATGSPLGYQWQRMALGTTTWSTLSDSGPYSGSATASLTVTNTTTAMSGDQFQCVVTYAGPKTVTSAQPTALIVETPLVISTLAGQAGTTGMTNGTGTTAKFNYPTGIAIDSSGNLYIADCFNNQIRKVTFSSPGGVVTATVSTPYGSLAGTAGSTSGVGNNGNGNSALFNFPRDIAVDASNNFYVADEGSNQIRKINTTTNQVTTISTSASPPFMSPKGVAVDHSGNVYVADYGNNVIRKIANGTVSIVAGSSTFAAGYSDGAATTQALFNGPIGLAVDGSGNIYVADYGNAAVRKISSTGVVSTIAGQGDVAGCLDGAGTTQALFNVPRGIMVDSSGNLYVTDSCAPTAQPPVFSGNNLLRKITPAGVVTTLAGNAGIVGSGDGTGSAAAFYSSCGVVMNASGNLYIADANNNTIRVATPMVIKPQTITFGTIPSQQFPGAPFLLGATASSGLPVSYSVFSGPATLSGTNNNTVTITGLGTVVIQADQAGNTGYLAATSVTQSFTIALPVGFSDWATSYNFTGGLTEMPFNDGVPNLLKYLYNINPGIPLSATARAAFPTVGTTTNSGTEYLTLTYRQYALETGITINVQTSSDLKTWTTVSPPDFSRQVGVDLTTNDPIMEVGVRATGSAKQFIRLNITSP